MPVITGMTIQGFFRTWKTQSLWGDGTEDLPNWFGIQRRPIGWDTQQLERRFSNSLLKRMKLASMPA